MSAEDDLRALFARGFIDAGGSPDFTVEKLPDGRHMLDVSATGLQSIQNALGGGAGGGTTGSGGGGGGITPTPPTGACRLPTTCTDGMTHSACAAAGGVWQGADSVCTAVPYNLYLEGRVNCVDVPTCGTSDDTHSGNTTFTWICGHTKTVTLYLNDAGGFNTGAAWVYFTLNYNVTTANRWILSMSPPPGPSSWNLCPGALFEVDIGGFSDDIRGTYVFEATGDSIDCGLFGFHYKDVAIIS